MTSNVFTLNLYRNQNYEHRKRHKTSKLSNQPITTKADGQYCLSQTIGLATLQSGSLLKPYDLTLAAIQRS